MQSSFPRILRITILAFATVCLAALTANAQAPSNWVQLNPAKFPPRRAACVMAYDPVSQKIVMFGGFYSHGYYNDTWTFDGTTWKRMRPPVSPPARAAAGFAFDSVIQKLIMFGGFDGQQYMGDTWMWDGATSTWTQMFPAHSPVPLTGPMLFPNPLNGRVMNFGGFDGNFYSLTSWRWRDGDWHKNWPRQSPYARGSAIAATNPVLKQSVMFGGLADVNPVNTWTFDGNTWTQQFPAMQLPYRFYSHAVYDPRFQGIVVFGGFSGMDVNDTWLWTGSNWEQLQPTNVPPVRESFGMAFDELHQQTVIYGGLSGNQLLNDTWVLQDTN